MGSALAGPKISVDPQLEKQRAEEKARLEDEKKKTAAKKADDERKRTSNLVGSRSLQDDDMVGFGGFRQMGSSKPSGSIRE